MNINIIFGVRLQLYIGGAVISWPFVCRSCKVLVHCEFRCCCRVKIGFVFVGCG